MNAPKEIHELKEFEEVFTSSANKPVFIFKYSPICPVSFAAQRQWESFLAESSPDVFEAYLINVITSKKTARGLCEIIDIEHQSPQAILLHNQKCIWHDSHSAITARNLHNQYKSLSKT